MGNHISEPYVARNTAAVTLAHLALQSEGWDAYLGRDEERWCKDILYIETPHGQMSYHIAPEDAHVLEGIPYKEDATWDGKFNGQNLEFAKLHKVTNG